MVKIKCSKCQGHAVIKTHDKYLCKDHFFLDFEERVKSTIKKYKLFTKKDKIVVAASGGKDSLTLMYLLRKFGHEISALLVDEGIKNYRDKTIVDFLGFCKEYNIDNYKIVSFKDEFGKSLDQEVKKAGVLPCSICGIKRRNLLNKYAKGYDVIATGHNIDDEAQAFLMNLLKGQLEIAARQGPKSGLIDIGFVPRVKPLYFCGEKEIRLYSFLRGFKLIFTECPYAVKSFRHVVGEKLNELEATKPGSKLNIIQNYLKMLPKLKHYYKKNEK